MRLSELPFGQLSTLEVAAVGGRDFFDALTPGQEAFLQFADLVGEAVLGVGAVSWPVGPADRSSAVTLATLRDRSLPRLAWVAGTRPAGQPPQVVTLQVHEFPSQLTLGEDVDIGVDEQVVEQVAKRVRRPMSLEATIRWLEDHLILESPEGLPRVFVTGSPISDTGQRPFRLLGPDVAVDAARGRDGRLLVTRIAPARRAKATADSLPIDLVRARLRFRDATIVGSLQGTIRTQLDDLVEQAGSYLEVWSRYNERERLGIERRAGELGVIWYDKRSPQADGRWRFEVSSSTLDLATALDLMRGDGDFVELEAGASAPRALLRGLSSEDSEAGTGREKRPRAFVGAFAGGDASHKILYLQAAVDEDVIPPPERGAIFLSLSGDEKRLNRRDEAFANVRSAECPMPQLGLLLEGRRVPERRRNTEEPLSRTARAAFGFAPTPRQVEALRVALNTPDIALIQGPPGTGKTRTIAALAARLADAKGEGSPFRQTLLTSVQHEAVETATARTLVFGLPAIKVGRKRGSPDGADGVDRWRRERVELIQAELAGEIEQPVGEALRRVRDLAAAYLASPLSATEASRVVREVENVAGPFLPPRLADRLQEVRHHLSRSRAAIGGVEAERRDLALNAVRAIRTDPISFGDDGPANAHRAIRRLEPLGLDDVPYRRLLERASAWASSDSPPFLEELEAARDLLIDLLSSSTPVGAPAVNADLEGLLPEVVQELSRQSRETAGGEVAALYEYLHDLEHDAAGVRDAVRSYTAVLAATCQQAAGFEMSLAKSEGITFDNVIVDEAARANPMDLLIPMSKARRRIILVGDHRQLPHILEPDIERELAGSVSAAAKAALEESLFERLFREMRMREATDGIKRTVTLDVQYRMHPDLAAFVSRTFYEPHGEGFGSARPASDFAHSLPRYEGKVAGWADIPLTRGQESGGQSKRRVAEAAWIAEEVKRLGEERRDFSIGVITFYAAQVVEILRSMEPHGLSERLDGGSYRVASGWQETSGEDGHFKERLRVGTVDAFQGKEFDIVILSMTRSNDVEPVDERTRRRKYGHLMLENRLCVAMSRQQRLLIVAGDALMARGDAAREAIPALAAFRDLCEGESGVCLRA